MSAIGRAALGSFVASLLVVSTFSLFQWGNDLAQLAGLVLVGTVGPFAVGFVGGYAGQTSGAVAGTFFGAVSGAVVALLAVREPLPGEIAFLTASYLAIVIAGHFIGTGLKAAWAG